MDEIYRKISDFKPRTLKPENDGVQFEVTELWRQHSTGAITPSHINKTVNDLPRWLDEETRSTNGNTESLVLRLVWTELHDMERIALSEPAKTAIIAKFGLELAYDYFQSTITGINAFPRTQRPRSEHQAYAFCYAPKLAAIWSHNRFQPPLARESVTYGLVLASTKQKKALKRIIGSGWQPSISSHSMFPAFLFTFMLDGEAALDVNEMKGRVQQIEERTGYKKFLTKRKKVASEERGQLLAEMSGFASKLASVERKSKTSEKLMDFIFQGVGEYGHGKNQHTLTLGKPFNGDDLMRNHVGVLRQRLRMQVLDTDFTLKRVQVQIEALVNLIAQNDAMNNMDIALSSHRDASSMKTLAVVTMFFLPGSFISALFSTPCFDWDRVDLTNNSISVKPTPQFSLYWAITIPLTLATFILYFFWLQKQNQQFQKGQNRRLQPALVKPQELETKALQERRDTMFVGKADEEESNEYGRFGIALQRLRRPFSRVDS